MDYFLHSMNWFSVFRHVMAAIIITVTNIDDSEGDCPEAYWDQPSKWCAYTLVSALEKVQPDEDIWNSDLRVNTTCTAWQQTNTCYQQLIKQCQANLRAVQELRMHVGRYWIYSLTCSSHTIRHNRHLVNCFLPHIKPTRTCTEAFDRTFRNFVNDKQFRNACRVVHTAMNCFNEIKNEISERCSKDGAIEYQRNYIQPLADQTRETVLSKCTLSPPYATYFNSAWSLQHSCSTLTAIVLVALLFARWRNLL